jgi:hypothetical protein
MIITKTYLEEQLARLQADINKQVEHLNGLIGAREAYKVILEELLREEVTDGQ